MQFKVDRKFKHGHRVQEDQKGTVSLIDFSGERVVLDRTRSIQMTGVQPYPLVPVSNPLNYVQTYTFSPPGEALWLAVTYDMQIITDDGIFKLRSIEA